MYTSMFNVNDIELKNFKSTDGNRMWTFVYRGSLFLPFFFSAK